MIQKLNGQKKKKCAKKCAKMRKNALKCAKMRCRKSMQKKPLKMQNFGRKMEKMRKKMRKNAQNWKNGKNAQKMRKNAGKCAAHFPPPAQTYSKKIDFRGFGSFEFWTPV